MTTYTATERKIKWGGVIKGAAIVTGIVAVAAVVGIGAMMGAEAGIDLLGGPETTANKIATQVWNGLSSAASTIDGWAEVAGNFLKEQAVSLFDYLKTLPGQLADKMNWKGAINPNSAETAKFAKNAGLTGLALGGAVGAAALSPALSHTEYTTLHTTTFHNLNEMAQHAAHAHAHVTNEEAAPSKPGFVSRVAHKMFGGSHADTVLANRSEAPAIAPRSGSYTDQLAQQSAALDQALHR